MYVGRGECSSEQLLSLAHGEMDAKSCRGRHSNVPLPLQLPIFKPQLNSSVMHCSQHSSHQTLTKLHPVVSPLHLEPQNPSGSFKSTGVSPFSPNLTTLEQKEILILSPSPLSSPYSTAFGYWGISSLHPPWIKKLAIFLGMAAFTWQFYSCYCYCA